MLTKINIINQKTKRKKLNKVEKPLKVDTKKQLLL